MHPHLFGRALWAPRPAGVLEVADEFLLLGVDRDHRLAGRQRPRDVRVDEGKLRVAVRMPAALACLGVGLQAEAEIVQQRADQGAADPVALGLQLVGEPAQALAGPAQRRFRIAARGRLDQGLESRPQLRIGLDRGLAARARPTQPARRQRALVGQVLEPAPDGARRQAGDLSHCRDAAIAGGLRFGGGPQAAPRSSRKDCNAS